MSQKKGGLAELVDKTIMPKVYGICAAVGNVGAIIKNHTMTGADAIRMLGIFTEAGIFLRSAF